MSRIRSSGSEIERILAKKMWESGIRYRKQYKLIQGKPDFALVSKKIVIFCDSAFWHGFKNMKTKLHHFKTNQDFWIPKIRHNIARDKEVNRKLENGGWKVLRFWDFQIKNDVEKCVEKILEEARKKL